MKISLSQALVLLMFLMLSTSQAHMRLVSPEPRTSDDPVVQGNLDNGYLFNGAPCGDLAKIPAGLPTEIFPAGTDVVITTDISQTHGGQAILLFISLDGETFFELEPASTDLPGSQRYVSGGFLNPPLGQTRLAVHLPDQASAKAILRVYDNYAFFMCADIELTSERKPQVFDDGFEAQ